MAVQGLISRYRDQFFALMRIAVGFLFMCHGIQKDIWIINGTMPAADILFYLAAVIESIAGLLILIGWQTNWAAFIASGEMAVAYFKSHAPNGFFPINNHGELAVFYCFVFLFIAASGAGIWSVDHAVRKNLL
jgi:putative oxidoreductase